MTDDTAARGYAVNRPASLDVVLRVLDHQVVGPEKELVGNIDDLELTPAGEALAVTGFASGRCVQPAATRTARLQGRRGVAPLEHRLRPPAGRRPGRPHHRRWVGDHRRRPVDPGARRELRPRALAPPVRRLPNPRCQGRIGPERKDGDRPTRPVNVLQPPTRPPQPGCRWVSALLRAPVVDDTGHRLGNPHRAALRVRVRAVASHAHPEHPVGARDGARLPRGPRPRPGSAPPVLPANPEARPAHPRRGGDRDPPRSRPHHRRDTRRSTSPARHPGRLTREASSAAYGIGITTTKGNVTSTSAGAWQRVAR